MRPTFGFIRTQDPGNIGSACRVLCNFGFSPQSLRLFQPQCNSRDEKAYARAGQASGWLDEVLVYDTWEPFTQGISRIWGTTAKTNRFLAQSSVNVSEGILKMPERTLILFGSEHHGLEHEEILLCDQLIHIPTSPTYGALNLAMSAGIVAFEWTRQHAVGVYASGTASGEAPTGSEDPGSAVLRKKTFEKIIRAAEEVGFLHSQHPYKLELGLKRVFARAQLTQNELQWVHGLFDQILTAQKSKLKLNMYVE